MHQSVKKECAGIDMNISTLLSGKGCSKKIAYASLGFLSSPERAAYTKGLMQLYGSHWGDPELPDMISDYITTHLRREWYTIDAQYLTLRDEEAAYHNRLASFFCSQENKKRVAGNLNWITSLPFQCGEISVKSVYGYVQAVVKDGDSYTAIMVDSRKPQYTTRSRSALNTPAFSPELLGAYLGLREVYGNTLKVQLVYARYEKDSPESPFRPEKQIVEADFSTVPLAELRKRFKDVFTQSGEVDCSICPYQALCTGMDVPLAKDDTTFPDVALTEPKFTKDQLKVVNFEEGHCAVYAVPGAGKTTALVYRLTRLLESGVPPKSILFVTFTNKAADEIRQRVKRLLHTECDADIPDICTFNALGWQILRDYPDIVGPLRLSSEMDERRILMQCIDEFGERLKGFSYRFIEGKRGLLWQLFSLFRRLDEEPDSDYSFLESKGRSVKQVLALKKLYQDTMRANYYISFDDQVTLASNLLFSRPDICRKYGQQWDYIMADEYQDCSQENVDLLYSIVNSGKGNLVVVGDTDQSIYEWRNGSPKHLLDFPKLYPDCEAIYMRDNFRSVRQILDVSNALIARNRGRIDISMVPHKTSSAKPYRVKSCSLQNLPTIMEMLRKSHYAYGDIAILSRNNAPLEKVKHILDQLHIESVSPSDLLIHDPFFVITKDVFTLYHQGFTPENDMAFYRYLCFCGCISVRKNNRSLSFYENLTRDGLSPLDVHDMASMLAYATEDTEQTDPVFLAFRKLFRLFLEFEQDSDVTKLLHVFCCAYQIDEEAPAVIEVRRLVEQQHFTGVADLCQYFNDMVLYSDTRKIEYPVVAEKVNLMTAHASKGKEFPVVIIIQAEDFNSKAEGAADEEARRLMYVAMTRAKKCLFLLETPYQECTYLNDLAGYLQVTSFAG